MGTLFLRVGLFLAAAGAILVGAILFLTGDALNKGVPYETYFAESVQGLEVGAPVKFRGVTLGKVSEIGLVSAAYPPPGDEPPEITRKTSRLVYVRWSIDPTRIGNRVPSTESSVETGLRARLASQGLTGLAYIELDFVQPDLHPPQAVPWTPRFAYIPSVPSTLAKLQDAGQQLLAKLNGIDVEEIMTQTGGLIEDLRHALNDGDGKRALSGLADLLVTLNGTVSGADVPGLVADLRRTALSVREVAGGKETRALIANAAEAADRFAVAANKLGPVIAALDQTARRADAGTSDVQAELGPLLRDLRAAVANLRDTTESLRDYPAGTLLGGPPPRGRDAR